jgi:hypothetical protein
VSTNIDGTVINKGAIFRYQDILPNVDVITIVTVERSLDLGTRPKRP